MLKITPAHDPNDFEVGNRHNLERIVVMNKDAAMNENASIYKGMTREECREKLLSNENYVNKAPKNIVDMDKQKLEEEKQKLELLMK